MRSLRSIRCNIADLANADPLVLVILRSNIPIAAEFNSPGDRLFGNALFFTSHIARAGLKMLALRKFALAICRINSIASTIALPRH